MDCTHCHKPLAGDFNFCPYCGTQVSRQFVCPSCHKQADPAWVSCPYCGYQLRGATAQQQPFNQPIHGQYHHGSSSGKHHRRKGFLGNLFSS